MVKQNEIGVVLLEYDTDKKLFQIGEETMDFSELVKRIQEKKRPFDGKFRDDLDDEEKRLLADRNDDPLALDEVDAIVAEDYAGSDDDDGLTIVAEDGIETIDFDALP